MTDNIQIYQSGDGQIQLEIKLEQETLWLPQSQISELFDTSTDNVSLHLKNIFKEQELDEGATTEDFPVVRQEGKRQVKRTMHKESLETTALFILCCLKGVRLSIKPSPQPSPWGERVQIVRGHAFLIDFEQLANSLNCNSLNVI